MASLNTLSGPLGARRAAHLLRRATMGPTRSLIDSFAAKTVSEAVDALLAITPVATKPVDHKTGTAWVDNFRVDMVNSEQFDLSFYNISWWMNNARKDNTIQHKMILFLHQNFITAFEDFDSEPYYDYLKLLEYYALGSYKKLANKMCFDNVMLRYLNGDQSSAGAPNENYAREFFELFTIGKGPQVAPGDYTTYTEADIKIAAKVLTGFRYTKDNNIKDAETGIRKCRETLGSHDKTNKTFGPAFGGTVITGGTTIAGMYTEVGDFVNMIFNQVATAKNICRKLYRFFIHQNITAEAEADIITPLATLLKQGNYEMKPVLKKLFESEHFYDADDTTANDEFIGGKIKSPLELLLGTMRFFDIQPPDEATKIFDHYHLFYKDSIQEFFLLNTGMDLFRPSNVAGYKPYYQQPDYDRLWINPTTIVTRYTLPRMFLEDKRIIRGGTFYCKFDLLTWIKNPANISDPSDGTKLVDELTRYLFPENPFAITRFNFFLNDTLLGSLSLINWRNEWNNYISTNNPASVLPQLQKLFKAIVFSQEYQLL
jgi:uncharacterized protein (DUF1800 family)